MVFLVAFLEGQLAYETVAAGARGYLSKEPAREKICDAIVSVARGGTALAPEVQGGLAEQVQERERSDRPSRLTPREQEVLQLISEGLSAPEMGVASTTAPRP